MLYFNEMHVGKKYRKLFHEHEYLYHNFRSLIAWGNSGNFISFICWGMFIFFTADIALVGAADRPAYKSIQNQIYYIRKKQNGLSKIIFIWIWKQ